MKTRNSFIVINILCAIALGACSTATPTVSPAESTSPAPQTATDNSSLNSNSQDTSTGTSSLACNNGNNSAVLTPEETEGPYFTANSPERDVLFEDGMNGIKLVLTGHVYNENCQPVANALLDFWQADANGVYDNNGYTLRGHQYTDANGYYELTTVIPGIYPGRTEHIHVKVQAPNGKLITSQLFFPGVSLNDSDGIFNENLLIVLQETSDGMQGQFNFVIPTQ